MRSRIAGIVAASLALTLAGSAARAQGPPGMPPPPGGMGGPGGPGFLRSPAVQEELELTDRQKEQLRRLEASQARQRREAFARGGDEGFDPQARMSAMNAMRREHDATVSKILDSHQKERLAQLERQREGLLAVARPEIAKKLKLTATQTRKVKAIVDEMRQAQFRSMPAPPGGGFPGGPPPGGGGPPGEGPGPGGPPPGGGGFPGRPPGGPPNFDNEEARARFAQMREAQEAIRSTATRKIGDVLTESQRAAFDKSLGKPFDFSKLRPGPGPGPGAGPGGPPEGGASDNDRPAPPRSRSRSRRGAER